jgi:hypothetical protein
MSSAQFHFPVLHKAISAGAEPKLPGVPVLHFDFRRRVCRLGGFSAVFKANKPVRAIGWFRGTRVAKQTIP